MAVQLFKDGQEIYVKPKQLQSHLDAGWSLDDPSFVEVSFDDIDANGSGKLSTDEVREAAKEAGIEGWETKRIKTLKSELGVE